MCFGGTTTVGPVTRSSRDAVIDERRRTPGRPDGVTSVAMVAAERQLLMCRVVRGDDGFDEGMSPNRLGEDGGRGGAKQLLGAGDDGYV